MAHWNRNLNASCALCQADLETRDHVLYDCRFAMGVWRKNLEFLRVYDLPVRWDLIIPWFKGLDKNRLGTKLITAAATRTMYELWRSRNYKIFREETISQETLIKGIIWYLKLKIGALDSLKLPHVDRNWLDSLGILVV
ncbi:hypothetical protein QQ045_028691 [Rhodiola kirilowii]